MFCSIKIVRFDVLILLIFVYFYIIKMERQGDKTEHFWHHLLFAFNGDIKGTEAAREVCAVYTEGTVPQVAASAVY